MFYHSWCAVPRLVVWHTMIRKVPLYEKPVIVGGFCLKLWVKTAFTMKLAELNKFAKYESDESGCANLLIHNIKS